MRRYISTALAFALAIVITVASASSVLAYAIAPAQIGAARSGAVRAASGSYSPHAEQIVAVDGKLYGLVSYTRGEYPEFEYAASEVIEFDAGLAPLRRVRLAKGSGASAVIGKNACDMAYADGKLFIPCYGGNQYADGVYGDLWVVDVATMTARQAIDTKKIAELSSGGMALPYSISISPDGKSAYLLIVTEQGATTRAKFYVTTPSDAARGKLPAGSTIEGSGFFWKVARGKDVLWMQAGNSIKVFDEEGIDLDVAMTEADLGANAYSIAPADDRLLYFASNYSPGGVIGTVTRDGATFKATKVATNLGGDAGDALVFAYPGGVALFEHISFGYAKDSLYIWSSIDDIAKGNVKNVSISAYNTHSAAAVGSKLYLACYNNGSADQDRGEFVCVDVSTSDLRATASYLIDIATDGDEAPGTEGHQFEMPDSIKTPTSSEAPTLSDLKAVVTDASTLALVETDANGVLKLSATKMSELAATALKEGLLSGERTTGEIALPIVSADVTPKAVSVITISSVTLPATDVGSVNLIKVKSPTELLSYELVERSPDFADGKFAILRGDTILKSTDEISADDTYTICVFIKDDGEYDLNGTPGAILDPMMIVTTASGEGHSGSGGGGGSCSTGTAVVLSAAALALALRRRQLCTKDRGRITHERA